VRALAIDQGTSATKAIVLDADAGVVADVDVPVTDLTYRDDAVEVDPESLWDSVVTAGRQALAAATGASAGASAAAVDVIGVGNQGETVLAWRRSTGAPVTTALVWQDRRARSVTDELADRGVELQRLTGLPLDPYFAAPKMAWLRRHLLSADLRDDPDVVVTTIDAWILRRLTGEFVTDAATASRTLLLDVAARHWSGVACAAFGLDEAAQPRVVGCDSVVGETSAFGPTLPVASAIVDQQAALFAQGCRSRGDAKCTYGTGAFLLATVGEIPVPSSAGLATSVAWQLANGEHAYCVDGQVYTVGAAVRWLERLGVIAGPEEVDQVGGSVTDTGGVQFVPSLAGVGAPDWDPAARGAFTGLTLATSREHLVRAVAEGIAAQVTLLVRAIETDLGDTLHALRVDGGLTRSSLVMQTQADLLGVPVEVYPHPCATAIGIGALALRGIATSDADRVAADALTTQWSPTQVYEPAIARDVADDRFAQWRAAYQATLQVSS
jgi:glycerol kinase